MARLFDFQSTAVRELLTGKHFIISGTGSGKTAMALVWAELMQKQTGKTKLLVVTTASKAKTGDFEEEAEVWAPSLSKSLSSFSVLSWHKLAAWANANSSEFGDYMVIFDEVQKASAGISSGMGTAFLQQYGEEQNQLHEHLCQRPDL